jgi:hypothetical protein
MDIEECEMNIPVLNHLQRLNAIGCQKSPESSARQSITQGRSKVLVVVGDQE